MNSLDRFFSADPAEFADRYIDYLRAVLRRIDTQAIARFIAMLLEARAGSATIFFAGNGGSAATASHFANDLAIGVNDYERPFRAVSLADNVAVLTALGNDFGYDDIFARQLRILGRKGDLLVGISASGNSPNLVRAFEYAKAAGIPTIALTAFDGGKLKSVADHCVHVPTEKGEYGPAEDAHMVLDHLVGAYLMRFVKEGGT